MTLRIAATLFLSTLAGASLACDRGEQQPEAAPVAAKAEAGDAAAEVKLADASKAGDPAPAEGDEGCIYREEDKAKAEEGCPHGAAEGADPASGEPGHFGAAFALGEPRALKDVLAAGDPSTAAIQVSGQIDSVCQKKGCWMVLKDGDEAKARILMKDHAFTVPMDAKGKPAIVEGILATRVFNEKQVKHLEKDGGGDPSAVSGERQEFVLTATGIRIPPNS